MGIRTLSYELRLLRSSLTAGFLPPSLEQLDEAAKGLGIKHGEMGSEYGGGSTELDLDASLECIVEHIEAGDYMRALSCAPVSVLFGNSLSVGQLGSDAVSELFNTLRTRIDSFLTGQVPRGTTEEGNGARLGCVEFGSEELLARELLAVAVGIAALYAFMQANVTGPQVNWPAFPAQTVWKGGDGNDNDAWARQQLMADGCDIVGKVTLPQDFGSLEAVEEHGWGELLLAGEARVFAAAAQLEAGLVEHAYGHNDAARQCFERAEQTCGLQLSLTGALGFRTIHQIDAKAQMVLVADSNSASGIEIDSWRGVSQFGNSESTGESEILLTPRLVDEVQAAGISMAAKKVDEGGRKSLSTIEQAIILAECLDVKKSNPDDELRSWQMAPFIEAVDAQQQSHPLVRALCQLLRIRWERLRTRTQQRAFLMMETLVEETRKGSAKVAPRMCYVFCVSFPTMAALLKEHAEMMVSCGLVGEALGVFEELELWDNLIDCYCLLGKKAAASDLIKQRLQLQPNDPRLWCSLGDVTLDDNCYRKAWEVSGHHFTRAQRSLARTAYNRGDYIKSMEHWKAALVLNPLHPDGWFALGSASLKARELDEALQAFTRSVQLNPDNGESWNNIAAINMHKKRSKEAFIAFREALKFKRNSWQMWENFAGVALDVANFGQAVLAIDKVLDLSKGKRVDVVSLSRLVVEIEARKGMPSSASSESEPDSTSEGETAKSDKASGQKDGSKLGVATEESGNGQIANGGKSDPFGTDTTEGPEVSNSNGDVSPPAFPKTETVEAKDPKEIDMLMETVGKLLARVVHSGEGGGEAWGLQARWHHAKGDLTMCIEASLKQVRAYQGASWQHNKDRFELFARASLQLCEAYIEIAHTGGGGRRELSAAQMHLRNTLEQGEQFSKSADYERLEACLQKVQALIKSL